MLVSVIMPAYNAEKYIRQAIDSVRAQTYCDWELIVVDDASKDNTNAIVSEYCREDSRVKLLRNPKNQGVSHTRKNGVEAAAGEWIAFLDSDDAWQPEKLEKQLALQKEYNAKLIFTGSAFMDSEGCPLEWVLHAPEKIEYRQLLKQNLISNSSVLIEKKAYQECAVLADDMHEDFACWLRFLRKGNIAYGVDEPLLIYRLSAQSKSGNKLKAAKMNWKTYRAVGLNFVFAAYYMGWYMVKSILKYKNLLKA
ncbi:MAG: glycosyltransferase [Fournierella sp.]|uniref:glycosyltransferase family 2 protein n=1 Tax=Allofournierella sp. TaxID=1940256 RepID=UPI002A81580A|nr:glycosyltransferase [Fournierella sp.]MDY4166938.1 glycosyltransferase [Fournierella sp.]